MKKLDLQAVVITLIFITLLILFAFFLMPHINEGWRYTYCMGRMGLYVRTLVYLLMIAVPLALLLRGKRKAARYHGQESVQHTSQFVRDDGTIVYIQSQKMHNRKSVGTGQKPSVKNILVIVFMVFFLAYTMDLVPTVMDLFSEPVTEDLYVDLHFSRSRTRSLNTGAYLMRLYNVDGESVQAWQVDKISWGTSLRFSMLETLTDDQGNVIFDPPFHNRWNRPKNGSYALFHSTITYYPHSGTRVEISGLIPFTAEEFPGLRNDNKSVFLQYDHSDDAAY